MEKRRIDLKNAVGEKGRAAANLFDKAKRKVVDAIDQNNDGEVNLKDVAVLKEQWTEKLDRQKQEADRKSLCPIFEDDLNTPDFLLSKLIRIAPMDRKHAESEVCIGSIGFESICKDLNVINIYPDHTGLFGLRFYPDQDSEIYYVDPCDRDHYIAMDDYFNYLRIVRVSELQRIAQALGARHFRVVYKEYKKESSAENVRMKAAGRFARQNGSADAAHESASDDLSKVEIAAEMECLGHQPVEPELKYFKKDPQIQNLVSLRMSDNALTHQVYRLELINSSGIKVKDAAKIDAALSAMKINGNLSVTKEAQSESRRFFEYEIDF